MRSLKAANGSRTGVSSYPLPTAAGVHLSMMIPFGTVKNERRVAVLEAVSAGEPKAGSIASSSGNARAVPAPRKKVRLGIDFLKIIMLPSSPHLKRHTVDDVHDQRRPSIIVGCRAPNDLADGRHVKRLSASRQCVCQEPFSYGYDQLVFLAEQYIPQPHRSIDFCAVRKNAQRIDVPPPSSQSVEILQRIAQRIHAGVAARTRWIGLMELHPLPHRETSHILILF